MNLSKDWNLSIGTDEILRGQGADPQIVRARKPALMKAAERARAEGLALLHPIAISAEVLVQEHRHERIRLVGGAALTGPLVTQQLGGAQRVVAAICTIGAELENTSASMFSQDPLYALALDGLGNAAVEILAEQVCGLIAAQVKNENLQASSPLSPGAPEWPVELGQPQIFALLDPSYAGVKLTSGGMMMPKKSVSFIVGVGQEMSQTSMCTVCSLQNTCRYQNA
jgi:Vitamin B12 dependent methionine synthase, activation domain